LATFCAAIERRGGWFGQAHNYLISLTKWLTYIKMRVVGRVCGGPLDVVPGAKPLSETGIDHLPHFALFLPFSLQREARR
jgi:hypothetical protein